MDEIISYIHCHRCNEYYICQYGCMTSKISHECICDNCSIGGVKCYNKKIDYLTLVSLLL